VIDDGLTGRVVRSFDEAVAVLPEVLDLDRRKVRRGFEQRFSAQRMAKDYLQLYEKLLSKSRSERRRGRVAGDVIRLSGDELLVAGLHAE
jgi:hypothetical protein